MSDLDATSDKMPSNGLDEDKGLSFDYDATNLPPCNPQQIAQTPKNCFMVLRPKKKKMVMQKEPAKKRAQIQSDYRKRLKNDREKWELYKTKQKLHIETWRRNLSSEQKDQLRKKNRDRNRLKRMMEKRMKETEPTRLPCTPADRTTRAQVAVKELSATKQREYWKEKQRNRRENMTAEERERTKARARQRYAEKYKSDSSCIQVSWSPIYVVENTENTDQEESEAEVEKLETEETSLIQPSIISEATFSGPEPIRILEVTSCRPLEDVSHTPGKDTFLNTGKRKCPASPKDPMEDAFLALKEEKRKKSAQPASTLEPEFQLFRSLAPFIRQLTEKNKRRFVSKTTSLLMELLNIQDHGQ